MKFSNDVAAVVAREFPRKILLVLVYSVYRNPPKRVTLHPNVMTQFCSMSWSWADPKIADAETGILRLLGRYSQRIGFYDYLVNGSNGSMPRGFARTTHRVIRTIHKFGARYTPRSRGPTSPSPDSPLLPAGPDALERPYRF